MHHPEPIEAVPQGPEVKSEVDPVCGMKVAARADRSAVYLGQTYYFCCPGCVAKFRADSEGILRAAAARTRAVPTARPEPPRPGLPAVAIYTCPMHPEVRNAGPGSCPECGMGLEPLTVSAEEDTSEYRDMLKRFWVSLAFSLPLLVLAMGAGLAPLAALHLHFPAPLIGWLEGALASPVVVWGGAPFFERAWTSLRTRKLNMFTLIGLGSGIAYGFSLFALLLPGLVPGAFKMDGIAPLYFEAAAVIITLVLLGQVLELRARSQTSRALKALIELAPTVAIRVNEAGREEEVGLDAVHPGDIVRVKPGAKIPVDGEVTDGDSYVDESLITGEPFAVQKGPGARVRAGTLNQYGSFLLRAEAVGTDTVLAQIVRLVADASRSRAPIQRQADRVAAWFVPGVVTIAAITFCVWALVGPQPSFAHALLAAISVLIVACPCALGLATPISVMVAIGRGASEGILVKDAAALEALGRVDALVFDKTGTLTEGKPRVQEVRAAAGYSVQSLLADLSALESRSEHPLAQALVNYAKPWSEPRLEVSGFAASPGLGIEGRVDGRRLVVGNAALMRAEGIDLGSIPEAVKDARAAAQTVLFVGVDKRYAGHVTIADALKSNTRAAVASLKGEGLRLVVLTGDDSATAVSVARQVGIDEVEAGVLPAGKARFIEQLQQQGHVVAMAGDGINDAPALARADVGIAMGTGAAIAMESAQVVLVKGDLMAIAQARLLSEQTMRNIRQNLFFAFIYNVAGIAIAAGVLYPNFGILLNPMLASAAMALSSVSVISNALRLRRMGAPRGPSPARLAAGSSCHG
jgi:heavy metal translocating P-type ATPase